MGLSTTWEDEDEATHRAEELDKAFDLGRQAARACPWTKFAPESLPPPDTAIIVWDSEFSSLSHMYCLTPQATLESAQKLHYTHWMLQSALQGPPKEELPVPAPVAAPTVLDRVFDDDLPFALLALDILWRLVHHSTQWLA